MSKTNTQTPETPVWDYGVRHLDPKPVTTVDVHGVSEVHLRLEVETGVAGGNEDTTALVRLRVLGGAEGYFGLVELPDGIEIYARDAADYSLLALAIELEEAAKALRALTVEDAPSVHRQTDTGSTIYLGFKEADMPLVEGKL